MLAGEDTKALEAISRYQTPADLTKAFLEQRAALSKRSEPLKITENSTPEQIAEFRKLSDVPDVPQDAKDLAYAEAYGIKAPDGYDLGEVEKSMLGQFAKQMNAAHVPKGVVQKVVAQHFEIQKSLAAQAEAIAKDKAKEWQGKLRDEIGSREYDARRTAAAAYLQQQFADNPDELSNILGAQLPGGGRLGDHPWLFNIVAEKAMGAGFTDRIEANALEAGGKSLAEQQREIESLMFKDRAAYDAAAAPGGKLDKLIALRQSRGELDEYGNESKRRRSA